MSWPIRRRLPCADYLWPYRTPLRQRKLFGSPIEDRGLDWYDIREVYRDRFQTPLTITYGEVATHNHFVLDRGGTAVHPDGARHQASRRCFRERPPRLLGLLNSSIACFWIKQVCHNKGFKVSARVSRAEAWERFIQANVTKVGQFPIPENKPLALARKLDALAQERQQRLPAALGARLPLPRADWHRAREQAGRLLREMVALQEELDWRCYRLYGVTPDELTFSDAAGHALAPPDVQLGERAFEIVMARQMAAGTLTTAWFDRHGSTPITEVPTRWPEPYRALVERRIERIEADRYVGLLERPEYKRRWNVDAWDDLARDALRLWLQSRLETPRYWPEPKLQTTRTLAATAALDTDFLAVAELYRGTAAFDVDALVADLVQPEAVPLLPAERYQPSGLRKRAVWEDTWAAQREEDRLDAETADATPQRPGESATLYAERLAEAQKQRKAKEVGDIPRPPRYSKSDFAKGDYWRLRGKLDVPKERFVSYPHGTPDADRSLLVGWAGWTHLEQANALAAWTQDIQQREGWAPERLVPLYAALAELEPWLLQWHNEVDPAFDLRLGDYYRQHLNTELHQHGLTREDLAAWEPPKKTRGRKKRA